MPERRKWLYRFGLIVSLVCLVYFCRRVIELRESLPVLSRASVERVGVATAACLVACIAGAWTWRYLLHLLGAPTRPFVAGGIFLTAQFGKYLPGNFAQHVGRVAIAGRCGLAVYPVVVSMILEFGIGIGVMLVFSVPVLTRFIEPGPVWIIAAVAVVGLACALIWSRRQDLRLARDTVVRSLAAGSSRFRWLLPVLVTGAGGLLSASALLVLDPDLATGLSTRAYVISVFCAAWVAGFATPGAPAGLGIRELILGEGLAPLVGIERATSAALLLRVATTCADLLAFGAGLVLLHRARFALAGAPAPD